MVFISDTINFNGNKAGFFSFLILYLCVNHVCRWQISLNGQADKLA